MCVKGGGWGGGVLAGRVIGLGLVRVGVGVGLLVGGFVLFVAGHREYPHDLGWAFQDRWQDPEPDSRSQGCDKHGCWKVSWLSVSRMQC